MKKFYKIIATLLLVVSLIIILLVNLTKKKEFSTNLYYMDTYIYVKIYCNNKNVASKILDNVENIYKNYHQLSDRYNHYDNLLNVYDIKNNELETETIKLDSNLYQLLEYAYNWQDKHNKFSIEIGNIIDVWKKYRDSGTGIPSQDELDNTGSNIPLILLEDNNILNNHPNLDLGSIAKGYATEVVGDYLESNGIDEYLINAGGNVKVGKSYQKKSYKIGVQSPVENSELLTVINGENISVITSGGYERNYEYNGNVYHHIIDPNTLMPSNYIKSVTVVTHDSALGDLLSTTLFLMDVEDGKELVKTYNAEAIWYTNDNEIIKSEGFNQYE